MAQIYIFSERKKVVDEVERNLPKGVTLQTDPANINDFDLVLIDLKHSQFKQLIQSLVVQPCFVAAVGYEEDSSAELETLLTDKNIDDVIFLPLRKLEFKSRVRHYRQLNALRDVRKANESLKSIITKIEDDLKLTRSIQKKFIPEKFSIPGMKIHHRYLAGLKSGGDYFDVFEFSDRTHVGVLVSDCTGYGLSSALISVMLRMAFRFGKEEPEAPSKTVSRILGELKNMMRPEENLSLFYGVLNKKTLEMNYCSIGGVHFYKDDELLTKPTAPLARTDRNEVKDVTLQLEHKNRLVVATDGFVESFGGEKNFRKKLTAEDKTDAAEFINECVYQAKKDRDATEGLPAQDCSLLVFDFEAPVVRLLKRG